MSATSVKLMEFDCRGCEFTEFKPDVTMPALFSSCRQGQFNCKGEETTTEFKDIDLSELSWYDYDEKARF